MGLGSELTTSELAMFTPSHAALQGENDLAAWVGKRVDMLLQQSIKMNMRKKADCLGFLGSYFRDYFGLAETAGKSQAAVSLAAELIVTVHQLIYSLANPGQGI